MNHSPGNLDGIGISPHILDYSWNVTIPSISIFPEIIFMNETGIRSFLCFHRHQLIAQKGAFPNVARKANVLSNLKCFHFSSFFETVVEKSQKSSVNKP